MQWSWCIALRPFLESFGLQAAKTNLRGKERSAAAFSFVEHLDYLIIIQFKPARCEITSSISTNDWMIGQREP